MRGILRTTVVSAILCVTTQAAAQYVYVSDLPSACVITQLSHNPAVSVYVHAPELHGVTAVHFRIDTGLFGPEDVDTVRAQPGATIVGGTLFGGMTVQVDPSLLEFTPLVSFEVIPRPPSQSNGDPYAVWTRDVLLFLGSQPMLLDDFASPADLLGHCPGQHCTIAAPDTVSVMIGRPTVFEFEARLTDPSGIGAGLAVDDEMDWVRAYSPPGLDATCALCPWDWKTVIVVVDVPADVAEGSLSRTEIYAHWDSVWPEMRTIWLKATGPVPIRKTTLGRIKIKYRHE